MTTKRKRKTPAKRKPKPVEFVRYKNPTDRVPWWRKVWVAVFGA